jgi:LPXTG-motif cell wall-anchored protein
MKKTILMFSLFMLFAALGNNPVMSQEQPKPKKDTVNMDTNAKPTFYYAEEDEGAGKKGKSGTVAIIAGVIVVIAAGAALLLRRKKK